MKPKYKRMLEGMKSPEVREAGAAPFAPWFLYILRCGDGSFYTGVTNDVDRRLKTHQEGKGSRYTRTRLPVELVHRESCGSRVEALKREYTVKAMSRQEKEALVGGGGNRGPT